MLTGAITEENANFVETWENVSPNQNYVLRLDVRGDERPELIAGPRKFLITSRERLITQDKIVDARLDPFTNGSFRPVLVPDDVNVESNPNALSDDDILRIFQSSEVAWAEYMKVVDSEATLRRMRDLADDADISLKRYRELEQRLQEVAPAKRITQKDADAYERMGGDGASGDSPRPRGRRGGNRVKATS